LHTEGRIRQFLDVGVRQAHVEPAGIGDDLHVAWVGGTGQGGVAGVHGSRVIAGGAGRIGVGEVEDVTLLNGAPSTATGGVRAPAVSGASLTVIEVVPEPLPVSSSVTVAVMVYGVPRSSAY